MQNSWCHKRTNRTPVKVSIIFCPRGSSVYGKREVPGQDFVAGRYSWFSRDQLSKCHLQSTLILLTEEKKDI